VWNKLNTTVALAVCYPEDADQVAAAVLCAKKAGVKPVPR
jgi:FAD/FMN-containing dehydrogenase